MSAYARKLKFVNFNKFYFPFIYNPEMATETSVRESDSHLMHVFHLLLEYYQYMYI